MIYSSLLLAFGATFSIISGANLRTTSSADALINANLGPLLETPHFKTPESREAYEKASIVLKPVVNETVQGLFKSVKNMIEAKKDQLPELMIQLFNKIQMNQLNPEALFQNSNFMKDFPMNELLSGLKFDEKTQESLMKLSDLLENDENVAKVQENEYFVNLATQLCYESLTQLPEFQSFISTIQNFSMEDMKMMPELEEFMKNAPLAITAY